MITNTNEIITKFLNKARNYHPFPPLIKNSLCDHNAKVCLKYGYVKLIRTTKTGNTYVITPKGHKFIKEKLQPKIFKLMRI